MISKGDGVHDANMPARKTSTPLVRCPRPDGSGNHNGADAQARWYMTLLPSLEQKYLEPAQMDSDKNLSSEADMENTYIVLLEDDQECLTNIKQCTRLAVWQRSDGLDSGATETVPKSAWQQLEAIPFTLSGCYDLAEMRTRIKPLEQCLPQGSIIAGTSISGLAYNEFSHMGFCLCELESFSPDILDALAAEVAAETQPTVQVPTEPVSGDSPGAYKINLMEVQAAHPEVSSKKALRPFLASTPFVELEIICSHMPPWLEGHMKERNLTCSRSRAPDGDLRLRISHTLCSHTPNSNGDRT